MIRTLGALLLLVVGIVSISSPAAAYMLPLIGAGGAIVTMIIGLATALLAALYLVFYNISRAMRKKNGENPSGHDDDTPDNTKSSA